MSPGDVGVIEPTNTGRKQVILVCFHTLGSQAFPHCTYLCVSYQMVPFPRTINAHSIITRIGEGLGLRLHMEHIT